MSAQPSPQSTTGARVLEVSELPVSQIRGYAADIGDVHFERRPGRTFLVTN